MVFGVCTCLCFILPGQDGCRYGSITIPLYFLFHLVLLNGLSRACLFSSLRREAVLTCTYSFIWSSSDRPFIVVSNPHVHPYIQPVPGGCSLPHPSWVHPHTLVSVPLDVCAIIISIALILWAVLIRLCDEPFQRVKIGNT